MTSVESNNHNKSKLLIVFFWFFILEKKICPQDGRQMVDAKNY
jgi:hypothetical protein